METWRRAPRLAGRARLSVEHDRAAVPLATEGNGSLKVRVEGKAVVFSADIDGDSEAARAVADGRLSGVSAEWTPERYENIRLAGGKRWRDITGDPLLAGITLTADPAYADATVRVAA